jgi:hypothetical protein
LILLGHKTIEVRSQRTNIRERVHIYAGRNRIEAEEEARTACQFGIDVDARPRGVLVGTIEIADCRPLAMSDSKAACFEIDRPAGGLVHGTTEGQEQRHRPRGARDPRSIPLWYSFGSRDTSMPRDSVRLHKKVGDYLRNHARSSKMFV